DRRILLWDFHQDDLTAPTHALAGPKANVFALSFSSSGRYLYSGDVAADIYKYDMSAITNSVGYNASPSDTVKQHEDSIRDLSSHPLQEDILLSASEDGSIVIRDGRAGSTLTRAQGTLRNDTEFTSVHWHPYMEHIFATGEDHGKCVLRDDRMAFGPSSSRRAGGVYATEISKRSLPFLIRPSISSIAFNGDGTKLAVTVPGYFPIIYSVGGDEEWPLAVCTGRHLPDGSPASPGLRTYRNQSTFKHGSFSMTSGGDEYYATGSDDFRAYIWHIPSNAKLAEEGILLNPEHWASQEPDVVGFATSFLRERYIPVELSTPHTRLAGHKSIVNNALFHPHFPLVVTSGVERRVVVHSASEFVPWASQLDRTPEAVREIGATASNEEIDLYRRALRQTHATLRDGDSSSDVLAEEDDTATIALFDQILRQEEYDIFTTRRTTTDSDDEEYEDIISL
ncbi:WD40 repeat-like protein, partial [Punctularia strigosozonata HHB-11173 SS5]|uniref:WD40 repeat-like protein n=1 Tax=Punctularia strigosozonata (strain HHB-11173) TaxID=741275 RepID=UPI0004417B19